MGLGLSIVGGSDTLLGAIFIHEVYQAGWFLGSGLGLLKTLNLHFCILP